jgi:hypothetical protein
MNQADVALLYFPPHGNGKTANDIGMNYVWSFLIQNPPHSLGCLAIPGIANVPQQPCNGAWLFAAAKRPVTVIHWQTIDANPVKACNGFLRTRMKRYDGH